ncbi:sulfate permease family protein [Paraburkholderia sp. BL10I2N1]|nr:sulfate permease family protein [Paraburkholderia sp. BL10I2N1]
MSAAAIALVSFTDISMLSQIYGLRSGAPVDRNREFVALGIANAAAGLFQGFSVAASGSRTPVAEAAGVKTQATGVAAALTVAGLLLLAPQALQNTPQAALAASRHCRLSAVARSPRRVAPLPAETERIRAVDLRWDAPFFFANAEIFRERVLQAVREAPTKTGWIVIAANRSPTSISLPPTCSRGCVANCSS